MINKSRHIIKHPNKIRDSTPCKTVTINRQSAKHKTTQRMWNIKRTCTTDYYLRALKSLGTLYGLMARWCIYTFWFKRATIFSLQKITVRWLNDGNCVSRDIFYQIRTQYLYQVTCSNQSEHSIVLQLKNWNSRKRTAFKVFENLFPCRLKTIRSFSMKFFTFYSWS